MTGRISIGIKTSPQEVDWPTLDEAWARIGEHEVFESVWMNDHITNASQERGGRSWESLTAMAALAHRVPGKWLGHGVLSNTFRHPVVLAKQATLLDHVTGGRFIVGLGAGWHVGEHIPFGIPLPDMPERFNRFESAVHVLRALFSDEATREPGVTRPDPFYPLDGATNMPGPLTPGGPPLWLGGNKRRGIALAASVAAGWYMPAVVPHEGARPSDLDYFSAKRDEVPLQWPTSGATRQASHLSPRCHRDGQRPNTRWRCSSRRMPFDGGRHTSSWACRRRSAPPASMPSRARSPSH
jgi:alkanesulfonate monooxygenase SsuD/methylene tetrahydromethanopterin reductase-like flavin-dependent oxidoreductase (luciferase family)